MNYTPLTSPPAPPLKGEESKITPPSLVGNRSFSEEVGGLGFSEVRMEAKK
jgi:hypothetical protein